MTVTVYPEEGEAPRIARALLAAAEHPRQVSVVSHPRFGFIVPEDVFERFEAGQSAEQVSVVGSSEVPAEEPKRRGRPRKNPDPVTSEEE